ncbi:MULTISPECIES: hypothetical protein [unclassified Sphingobium]|jgi:hypothetical protein|uniref:hypothetical protein n=1 Tax=unclassified Sphingobium TaxID=2611147 RepID=UPI000A8282EE
MARQKVIAMFTLVAATLFSAAFLLAVATIAWMFAAYHDKMVAALLFQPIPQTPQVYHIRVSRPRVTHGLRKASLPLPAGGLTA